MRRAIFPVAFRRAARVLLPTVAAFAGGALTGTHHAEATSERASPYDVTAQMGRVLVAVENEYVDPVDRARLVDGAIAGMVSELDPHSDYMRPQEWKEFHSETEGKFGGVGIEVDARSGAIIVVAPIEGSPAAKAGIKSGDLIVAVDGLDVRTKGLENVIKQMRGVPGTHVKLTVLRGKQDLTFDLERQVIHVRSVVYRTLPHDVGYVRIKQFQDGTHDELLVVAAHLREDTHGKLAGMVLDLRTNPGGLVDEATEIADEFLTSGTIYTMRHRGEIVEEASAHAGGAFANIPVVVLVDEWSASASELLTGALQDQKRASVVGVLTFGKGSVQSIIELPGGAGLKLTTARYYTPSGHAVQADGIHPDVVVERSTKKGDADAPSQRERDQPNHLPAEGPQGGAASQGAPNVPTVTIDGGVSTGRDGGIADTVAGIVATDVPADPETSDDAVLRIGYQVLRTKMSEHATPGP